MFENAHVCTRYTVLQPYISSFNNKISILEFLNCNNTADILIILPRTERMVSVSWNGIVVDDDDDDDDAEYVSIIIKFSPN